MPKRIRIVSDLHIGHNASCLSHISQAKPLAEGVDKIIFNGDTLELKYGDPENLAQETKEQYDRFVAELETWGIETVLITGNHDPAISDLHFLELLEGKILVTHGDGMYREITPWSSNLKNLKHCAETMYSGETDLGSYLKINKQVSLKAHSMDKEYNPTVWGRMKIFLHQMWPPTTPFKILKCWKEAPDKAVQLAREFNLTPQFIVIGHTHNPGIWTRGDQTIINLGSYFPWPASWCLDIEEDTLTVRQVHSSKSGIEVGSTVKTFTVTSSSAQTSDTSQYA